VQSENDCKSETTTPGIPHRNKNVFNIGFTTAKPKSEMVPVTALLDSAVPHEEDPHRHFDIGSGVRV